VSTVEVGTRVEQTSIQLGPEKRLMVAAGRASQELGGKIAERLGVGLTDAGLKTFTDGEVYCRYQESIRGADIFIVQSIVGNHQHDMDVNDSLMELLVMIEAAVGASAHRVIAATP
jgi:ribose-phosphate pyrophosphokinase